MSESTLSAPMQLPTIILCIPSLKYPNALKYLYKYVYKGQDKAHINEETNSDTDHEEIDLDAQYYHSIQTAKSSAVSPMSDDDYEYEYQTETIGDWDFKSDTLYVGKIRFTIKKKVSIIFFPVIIYRDQKWITREQSTDKIINKYFEYKYTLNTRKIHIKDGSTNDKPSSPEIHDKYLNNAQLELDILKIHVQAMTNKMKKLTLHSRFNLPRD